MMLFNFIYLFIYYTVYTHIMVAVWLIGNFVFETQCSYGICKPFSGNFKGVMLIEGFECEGVGK